MLYEICKNPDVQEKLRAEINETISKYGDLTYDATNEMPYFTQIMNGKNGFSTKILKKKSHQ